MKKNIFFTMLCFIAPLTYAMQDDHVIPLEVQKTASSSDSQPEVISFELDDAPQDKKKKKCPTKKLVVIGVAAALNITSCVLTGLAVRDAVDCVHNIKTCPWERMTALFTSSGVMFTLNICFLKCVRECVKNALL